MSDSLRRLALRAAQKPLFVASRLAVYQIADTSLAAHLGCQVDDLVHLRLCMNPRSEHFVVDVQRIAEQTHVTNVEALASLLTQ